MVNPLPTEKQESTEAFLQCMPRINFKKKALINNVRKLINSEATKYRAI
jgi:hypothetical protein